MVIKLPVTRTKILVPRRRPELLTRPRLLDLLNDLLDHRLILVTAPAGYGKTSLLVDFANATPLPVCWYAIDSLDADPLRFITSFIYALQVRFPNLGENCLAALQSMGQDQLNVDTLVSLLIEDTCQYIREPVLFILDDFHQVGSSSQILMFINRFVQQMDDNCHLALASRAQVALPDLSLMLARSQVGALSLEEISFQPDEIQRLLWQNYHVTLSGGEAADLAHKTEGWVTGLLLSTEMLGSATANRLRVERAAGVGLYAFMVQQVLEQQPEELQRFLMRSSLLVEFDADLCQDVVGAALSLTADWQTFIDRLLSQNLFVLPVGEEQVYLRYHPLFQEFLVNRIQRIYPDEARLILLRLADTCMSRQEWERACQIYQQLGEDDAVVNLLIQAGAELISQGRMQTLTDWLRSLPTGLIHSHPALLSLWGVVLQNKGESSLSLEYLNQAVAGLRSFNDSYQLALTLVRRATVYRMLGMYAEGMKDCEEAQTLTSPAGLTRLVFADAVFSRGVLLLSRGESHAALDCFRQAFTVYQQHGDDQTAAKVRLEIARTYRAHGQYAEAEQEYLQAMIHYKKTGNRLWQANLLNNLGVLQHARGDLPAAAASFEQGMQHARAVGTLRLEAYLAASLGDLYFELDAVDEALGIYRQARENASKAREESLLFYLLLAEARVYQSQMNRLDPTAEEAEAEVLSGRVESLLNQAQAMANKPGWQLERKQRLVARGCLRLRHKQFIAARSDFQAALVYFKNESHQGEIPRASLNLLLVDLLLGERSEAAGLVIQLSPMLDKPEELRLLIEAGRMVKSWLEKVQDAAAAERFIKALLVKIEEHEERIHELRRAVRHQVTLMPFAPPKIVIRTLGKVQVRVEGMPVSSSDWQVQTARDLFLLILAHPEGLTKEEIGEILWPGSTASELRLRFKNAIYRLRHAVGKDTILFQGESLYLFNRSLDYEYDVETFLYEMEQAKQAEGIEQIKHFRKAVEDYQGPYLLNVDGTWAQVERERLFRLYIDALLRLANLALNDKNYDDALSYTQKVLGEDPCQEEAHRIAMHVFSAMGSRSLIVRQFEQCQQALLRDLNTSPSTQTLLLYQRLLK